MPDLNPSQNTGVDAAFRRLSEAVTRIQKGESKVRSITEKRGEGHYVVRRIDEGSVHRPPPKR